MDSIGDCWAEVIPVVKQIVQHPPIPFISLASPIQTACHCLVEFTASDKYPYPALCQSSILILELVHSEEEKYYLPCHQIIVKLENAKTLVGRMAVGHEIGHIMCHFQKYQQYIIDGQFDEDKFLENNVIKYTQQEEIEAWVFAAILVVCRSGVWIRPPESVVALRDELVSLAPDFISKDVLGRILEDLDEAREEIELIGRRMSPEAIVALVSERGQLTQSGMRDFVSELYEAFQTTH